MLPNVARIRLAHHSHPSKTINMASLSQKDSGLYMISFRFASQRFYRSLETVVEKQAREKKALIERTLRHIREGATTVPEGLTTDQIWLFLSSGGKLTNLPRIVKAITIAELSQHYLDSWPDGSKEESSLNTERTHFKHFERHFGSKTAIQAIGVAEIRKYIRSRQKENGLRGKKVAAKTINKELQTFRQVWTFARTEGIVQGDCPCNSVAKPKPDEEEPFKTYDEILTILNRGGLTDHETSLQWDCLFLREAEVLELLKFVRSTAADEFVLPMFALAAYTGCRRSEMMRSQLEDIGDAVVSLREKKRKHDVRISFRQVELHPKLKDILQEWREVHPGGKFTICRFAGKPLSPKEAVGAFKRALRGSKWEVVPGFHCFRHSFASICALKGIPQAVIDGFLGHQTEAMRNRYRHLFPESRTKAMGSIFS